MEKLKSESPVERTRSYEWEDLQPGLEALGKLSGREFIEGVCAGELPTPPLGRTMGFQMAEVGDGRVVFECVPAEYHYNPLGVAHGGLAATLLDSALGCSIQTKLPAGVGYTTLELKVNYIRPMTSKTGRVRAIGEVIHVGRKSATSEWRIIDENGKLYAHATTTCIVFQPE